MDRAEIKQMEGRVSIYLDFLILFSLQKLLIIAGSKMTSHYRYCEMKSYSR